MDGTLDVKPDLTSTAVSNINAEMAAPQTEEAEGSGLSSWIFSAEELYERSPTVLSGWTLLQQEQRRREACTYIVNSVGRTFRHWAKADPTIMRQVASSALLLFHKFFVVKSMADYDALEIATMCIHLAGKVNETVREFNASVDELLGYRGVYNAPKESEVVATAQEKLYTAERHILYATNFDFDFPRLADARDCLLRTLGLSLSGSAGTVDADTSEAVRARATKGLELLQLFPLVLQFGFPAVLHAAVVDSLSKAGVVIPRPVFDMHITTPEHVIKEIQRQYTQLQDLISSATAPGATASTLPT